MPPASVRSRRLVAALAFAATGASLQGCSIGGDSTLPPYSDPANTAFGTTTGVTAVSAMTRVNAQLYTEDLTVGTGRTVAIGDSIGSYYTGRLSGGFLFDSRARPSTPFPAILDTLNVERGVIKGWVQGLAGMKVGGIRRLVIGPESAYRFSTVRDQFGNVIIPANSVLVFDVEVTDATAKP